MIELLDTILGCFIGFVGVSAFVLIYFGIPALIVIYLYRKLFKNK